MNHLKKENQKKVQKLMQKQKDIGWLYPEEAVFLQQHATKEQKSIMQKNANQRFEEWLQKNPEEKKNFK